MLPYDKTNRVPREELALKETLWHCQKCEAVITVHSVHVVSSALCPLCRDTELEFCGTMGILPGQGFASA